MFCSDSRATVVRYGWAQPNPIGFILKVILILVASATFESCARTEARWRADVPPPSPVTGPISVLVLPGPALPPDTDGFASRLLGIVHERFSGGEIVHVNEAAASRSAADRGARYLLIATVLHWRDAQTQYSGEPDGIGVALRLMQVRPLALVREVQFEAQGARFAVRDAPADRLLGGKFRDAVRRLLAPAHP